MSRILWLLAAAWLGAAQQLDSDTITVTSRRTPSTVSDDVTLYVYVSTANSTTLDDVIAALSGTGISASNLQTVYSYSTRADWSFSLSGPFAGLQPSLRAIAGFLKRDDMDLSYQVNKGSSMPQQSNRTCDWSGIVEDARAQALKFAGAVGARVGSIVALSDEMYGGTAIQGASAPTFARIVNSFTFSSFLLGALPVPTCSLTVQFQLLR